MQGRRAGQRAAAGRQPPGAGAPPTPPWRPPRAPAGRRFGAPAPASSSRAPTEGGGALGAPASVGKGKSACGQRTAGGGTTGPPLTPRSPPDPSASPPAQPRRPPRPGPGPGGTARAARAEPRWPARAPPRRRTLRRPPQTRPPAPDGLRLWSHLPGALSSRLMTCAQISATIRISTLEQLRPM